MDHFLLLDISQINQNLRRKIRNTSSTSNPIPSPIFLPYTPSSFEHNTAIASLPLPFQAPSQPAHQPRRPKSRSDETEFGFASLWSLPVSVSVSYLLAFPAVDLLPQLNDMRGRTPHRDPGLCSLNLQVLTLASCRFVKTRILYLL